MRLILFILANIAFVSLTVLVCMIGVMMLTSDNITNEQIALELILILILYPVYKLACKLDKSK